MQVFFPSMEFPILMQVVGHRILRACDLFVYIITYQYQMEVRSSHFLRKKGDVFIGTRRVNAGWLGGRLNQTSPVHIGILYTMITKI